MRDASLTIRPFVPSDWGAVWQMLEPTFRSGETYAVAPDISQADARRMWVDIPSATYVACDASGAVIGTYFLKPNQAGPGSHVCNCGYVVHAAAAGRGVASAMCAHSQQATLAQGFRAMQFNLVVSTNEAAVHLWRKHGFAIAGVLPGAFHHHRLGFVDAFVMFKPLSQ